jgi:hypothetical protein
MRVAVPTLAKSLLRVSSVLETWQGQGGKSGHLSSGFSLRSSSGQRLKSPVGGSGAERIPSPSPKDPSLDSVSWEGVGNTGGWSGTTEQLIRSPGPHPNNFSISSLGVCILKKSLFLLNYVPQSLPLYSFSNSVPVNSSYFIAYIHSLNHLQ